MAPWRATLGRARSRLPWLALPLLAVALFLALASRANAAHEPLGPCSPGFENVRNIDPETFFDGRSNLTICLAGDVVDPTGRGVQWSNMSHVTIRSAPGAWRAIRSRIWIDETSADVTLLALTLDSSRFEGTPGKAGVAVNADRVALRRNLITNGYGAAGSCITNDADFGVADDTVIVQNRIFDCGRDETHDHGVYTNAMNRPVISANWIYENAGRGINLGPYTYYGRITRNVIADNCANPLGGVNDCSGNVIYWGFSRFTEFNNNTVAFPHHRYNLAGCDFGPDTPDCHEWGGSNNLVARSCFYSAVSGYSGDPPGSGISPGWHEKFGRVDHSTLTVADPRFANRTTPAHAWRNYRIPSSNACSAYQPAATVGPPA